MTRDQLIKVENAGNKLACVPINPQYNGEWAENQQNFVDFIGLAGDYLMFLYNY